MSLQEQQAPIDRSIVEAMIAATPDTWSKVEMRVERRINALGDEQVQIAINSPEGRPEPVSPSDDICEGVYKLIDVFMAHGKVWSEVVYQIELKTDGNWHFTSEYNY